MPGVAQAAPAWLSTSDPAPSDGPRPIAVADALYQLPVPAAASGEGILSINPTRWGKVSVNGHSVGDSPKEVRLPAGRHTVWIDRGGRRRIESVTVKAGSRTQILR